MTLAFEDELKIFDWIAAGSPRDGAADPLAQLTWPDSVWMFDKKPDLIIEVPEQSISPTGVVDYINVVVPIDIDRDR
jgi:hypothetical protein